MLSGCLAVSGGVASAANLWTDPRSGIEFVHIPPGCFVQGEANAGATGDGMPIPMPRADEVPQRRVCVDGFWLGRTEVTETQWSAVMSGSAGAARQPRRDVSWDQAQEFLKRLGAQRERQGFRLPSEAEWEFACHAGKRRPVVALYGQDRLAWTVETGKVARFGYPQVRDPQPDDVASRDPNAYGLHDMLGNVWEWTADAYRPDAYRGTYQGALTLAPDDGRRVIRGGSYKSDIAQVRCGTRNWFPKAEASAVVGFRVVVDSVE